MTLKSDFILSLMELIVGGKSGLEPVEKTVIDRCVHMVYRDYLQDPCLELSEEKTVITHIGDGFDMLGWTFRKFKGKLIVKPSKKALKALKSTLSETILGRGKAWKQEDLIGVCIQEGILYESRKYQNCVFIGKDMEGRARFACVRGTRDNFRMDIESSDKRYNFYFPAAAPACSRLAVAESPIDALSVATLVMLSGGDYRDSYYLALGGNTPNALLQFLHDHPQITQVSLCLDNDKGGTIGMERIEKAIQEEPELSQRVKLVYRNPPPKEYGKDYNEFLCACVHTQRQQRQRDGVR